jgi:hypothetical protein
MAISVNLSLLVQPQSITNAPYFQVIEIIAELALKEFMSVFTLH